MQICSGKKREREKKAKHAALNHTRCAFPRILFSIPDFLVWSITQGEIHACNCWCVCHWEWVCVDGSRGRCERLEQIFIVVGLNPVFSSRLWLCVCVCVCEMQVRPMADTHHHVEWYASRMLIVWQQHIIISLEVRTEWSLQPPPLPTAVCSALIYMLKSSVVWSVCLGDESEIKTAPCKWRLRFT